MTLRWLRCPLCFNRRYVIPSEGWPVCKSPWCDGGEMEVIG